MTGLESFLVLAAGALEGELLTRLLLRWGKRKANYQGGEIVTAGGLIFLPGALLVAGAPAALRAPAAALLAYGTLGLLDDLWGTAEHKGLRGHLGALRQGRVTTGLVKAVGGGLAALVLAWALRPEAWLPAAAVVALTANLFNLLDLRPLRTLKAFWLLGLALAAEAPAILGMTLGVSLPYAVREARRRVMLGDTGSNALGGLIGALLAGALPEWGLWAWAGALALFHVWAEKHSLTAWIEARPVLRAIDGWGWRR